MNINIFSEKDIENMYFDLIKKYQKLISDDLRRKIRIILDEVDENNKKILIVQLKTLYKLTNQQVNEYLLAEKVKMLYQKLLDMAETLSELTSDGETIPEELISDFNEFGQIRNNFVFELGNLKTLILKKDTVLDDDGRMFDEDSETSKVDNFIVFLDSIEDDREITMNSKSGKGFAAISSILKEINNLMYADYQDLRKKGNIHQINDDTGDGMHITSSNVAFERVGGGTTKIGYIRLPVCNENRQKLNIFFNNSDWKYIFLIINFGDFKNEGISEKKLYTRFKKNVKSKMDDIDYIVRLFNTPFNEENFAKACYLIQNGFDKFHLLADSPNKSLASNIIK